MQETRVQSLGRKDALEKGMATHSSTLAWRIPWTENSWRVNQRKVSICLTVSSLKCMYLLSTVETSLLPGKSHGRRSLVGCSPWGHEESDTTERLPFHFSLSCIGEGNGNPLQCSCLENPRDGGACWAAVYGVSQSRTRLKRLGSCSSSSGNQQEFRELILSSDG